MCSGASALLVFATFKSNVRVLLVLRQLGLSCSLLPAACLVLPMIHIIFLLVKCNNVQHDKNNQRMILD